MDDLLSHGIQQKVFWRVVAVTVPLRPFDCRLKIGRRKAELDSDVIGDPIQLLVTGPALVPP